MDISRRNALKKIGAVVGSSSLVGWLGSVKETEDILGKELKGKVNHSVCKWCYDEIPLDEFCKAAKEIGLKSVELVGPDGWPTLKKHGLTCAMPWGAGKGITEGFNNPDLHDELIASYEEVIPQAAEAGLDKIICFSGNRNGMDDQVGLENCAEGLKRLMPTAEKHGVTVCMELLNSKVDHPDYMCDHTNWGVDLCKRVGSDRFKLLYDIYHMQIMEGDVIRTIRENHQYIAHYHTGGVPGRNEIDETQELYYPAIVKAILDTGYTGFIGQEFIPTWDDELEALKQGVEICDV
ncbi:TIM barrel protein [Aliifodinibius sp. S!AR15-10]|uniref:hydroxypyruvate isomerase family protein n=1 Tax=Aliifodinibius sp. S!AR15-10 TaxID=2950437 RepID=UPI002865A3AE|nr:TIM barrel protein [Aliifodinibius sp. S!AR15-10]MDR8391867.1 TIM barrel protein [Aliifodinibius sp. S!AR15-10]